jgi:hypothetical protein
MRLDTSHERTMRLLAARLQAIAVVSERLPAGASRYATSGLEREVRRAAAATRNAVGLDLITGAEATEIWAAAVRQHPEAPFSEGWRSLAA